MINLSDYHDYRLFLRDWINAKQEDEPSFTWRVAGQVFDLETATLFRVCSCERHLPLKCLEKILEVLNLSERDVVEFKLLVELGRAKKEEIQKKLRFELLCHRSGDVIEATENVDARYFSSWIHPVLFSILHTYSYTGTRDQVALAVKKSLIPKASLREISESLTLLKEIGLVEMNGDVWIPTAKNPLAKLGWTDGRVRNFQRSCMDLATTALETQPKELRNMSTLTLHLTHHAKTQIESEIEVFRNRIKSIVEADEGADLAMQLNIQLFSLSRTKR